MIQKKLERKGINISPEEKDSNTQNLLFYDIITWNNKIMDAITDDPDKPKKSVTSETH